MKRLFTPLLFVLLCSFVSINEWVNTKADAKVSFDLPKKPEKEKSQGAVIYSADNEGCLFLVTVSPLPAKLVPEEPGKVSKFLDGILDGNLKASQPEDAEKKDITVGTAQGKEVSYTGVFPGTETRLPAAKRILLVDKTLYVFDIWFIDEAYADAVSDQEKFFTSIKVAE